MNRNPDRSNLKPFKKGQSGNPKGRPKKLDIKEAVQEAMALEKNGMNGLQAMVMKLLQEAIKKGDVRAAEFLAKYGFGLPNQMPADVDDKPKEINVHIHTTNGTPRKAD